MPSSSQNEKRNGESKLKQKRDTNLRHKQRFKETTEALSFWVRWGGTNCRQSELCLNRMTKASRVLFSLLSMFVLPEGVLLPLLYMAIENKFIIVLGRQSHNCKNCWIRETIVRKCLADFPSDIQKKKMKYWEVLCSGVSLYTSHT